MGGGTNTTMLRMYEPTELRLFPTQPGVTEGGVVLHQNNTYTIMAGGCHIVMTAACSFNTRTSAEETKRSDAYLYQRITEDLPPIAALM